MKQILKADGGTKAHVSKIKIRLIVKWKTAWNKCYFRQFTCKIWQ